MDENVPEKPAPSEVAICKPLRAHFIEWAIETALGFLFFVVMFGNVAAPQFLAVNTAGWDPYSALMWGFVMLVTIGAFMMRVIRSAKENFSPLF